MTAREQALHDALREILALFPSNDLIDKLDDDEMSGRRLCHMWTNQTPAMADVRRWRAVLAALTVNEEKEQIEQFVAAQQPLGIAIENRSALYDESNAVPDTLSDADIDDTLAAIARVAEAARVGANYCALISYGTLMEVHEIITRLRE